MTKSSEMLRQQKFDAVLKDQIKFRRIFCVFENGHLHIGTCSLHRTVASRRFRMLIRFKQNQ